MANTSKIAIEVQARLDQAWEFATDVTERMCLDDPQKIRTLRDELRHSRALSGAAGLNKDCAVYGLALLALDETILRMHRRNAES